MVQESFQSEFLHEISNLGDMLDALGRIPGAMFMIKNCESRYIYMSRALSEAIHVVRSEEVVGKTDFDLFPRIIAEHFRQNDLLVIRDGRTLVNEIHATALLSGPTKWFLSSKFPLRNRANEIIGLLTINETYSQMIGHDSELDQLLPAIEHITLRFAEKINIADLAGLCGLSQSHFMRIFKRRIEMTAYAFLEQVRMHHAIHAVKHSRDSIASIAHGCGFYDHSSFVKRFRKVSGTTPLKYRRDYQSQFTQTPGFVLPEPEV